MKELDGRMRKLMRKSAREVAAENKESRPDPVAEALSGMSQKQFKETIADKCESKNGWECALTKYVCKDYLCPKLKKGAIQEK